MALIIKKIQHSIIDSVKSMLYELNYKPEKRKVFIKPNIAIPTWPNAPYITNPEVVAGVIDYLKEIGIDDIKVGDGPVPIGFGVEETLMVCGYTEMCKNKKVEILNPDILPRMKITGMEGAFFIPEILSDHEYINIAKFKTHYQTAVSLALKNQKGLLAPEDKNFFHLDLHRNIARLAQAVRPALSIIDGTNGLEGNGPVDMGEEVADFNVLAAGTHILALDQLACMIMGINPEDVEHLKMAEKYGLKSLKEEKIDEEILQDVKRFFKLPSEFWKRGNLHYWWSDYTCSRCSIIEGQIIEKLEEIPREKLEKIPPVAFITGPPKTEIPDNFKIYGLGKCASLFCRKFGFTCIDGCPPEADKVMALIKENIF